jgi:pimeloyl-ACP methyl ester carboxylesterase
MPRARRVIRAAALLLVTLVGGAAAYYAARNPEDEALDAEARAGAPGGFVDLADGRTHFVLEGPEAGMRVVLVHGFSVPLYIWDSTAAALTGAGHRVLRYDLFGRGYSDRPRVRYDADLFDRQLTGLLDSLGWHDPVHVVGLSMGGLVAATVAGRHPARVRSLTLIAPAADPRSAVHGLLKVPLLGRWVWQTEVVPDLADGQLGDFAEPDRWPGWPDRYRAQMRYRGFGRALLSTLREAEGVSTDSVYAQAARAGVPVLLIWGTGDRVVPFANSEGVRRALPDARFVPVERAGHLPHMERTDVVNPLLLEFLGSPGGGPTG